MTKRSVPRYFLFVLLAFLATFLYLLFTRRPPVTEVPEVIPRETPSPVTLTGVYSCLPKKNTGGPVTLECAFGLKAAAGYYALDLSAIPSDNYPALTDNETITVEGSLIPARMVSSDRFLTYDAIGVIAVEKVIKK